MYIKQVVGMGIDREEKLGQLFYVHQTRLLAWVVSFHGKGVPIAIITFGLETNHSFMDPFPIGIWDRGKVGEIRNLYF